MANLRFRAEMAHWEVKIFKANLTQALRPFISGITCEYTTDDKNAGIPKCMIDVTSQWFLEDLFRDGVEVSVKMGWDRQNMANMIFGTSVFEPSGKADSKLSYRINVKSKAILLARNEKASEAFHGNTKEQIIKTIALRNEYESVIKINDKAIIPKDSTIRQGNMKKGETDLELLQRLARQWHGVVWIDDNKKTIYFYDADEAHDFGDSLRVPNIRDIVPGAPGGNSYPLHYRFGLNNLESLSWKKKKALKGDPSGKEPAVSSLTAGVQSAVKDDDFTLETEVNGERKVWVLKERFKNQSTTGEITKAFSELATANEKESWLNKYFVKQADGSRTIENETRPRGDKRRWYELTATLNVGDEFLRPPRTAILKSGESSGFATNEDDRLPGFLFQSNESGTGFVDTRYNINKVTTSLVPGRIKSTLLLHR